MDILFKTDEGRLGPVLVTRDFIIMDRPKLTGVIPIKAITYVGYPKEWIDSSGVQVLAGGNDHTLYMSESEAKNFVDTVLALIAPA